MSLVEVLIIIFALVPFSLSQLHPNEPAQYRTLPSLREQATILDGWRDVRLARLPQLLQKYELDAWLISQREYAEDTIWWSVRSALEFAPHRRTVMLFHTNTSSLAGRPNPLKWVDNTGAVWPELLGILETFDPNRIAVNIDRNIAFGGGLHVGEWDVLQEQLGEKWVDRMVNQPMLGIEFVAGRIPGQIEYYRLMQETTWALIEEAFSERVITPGVTSTEDVEWWYRDKIQERNFSTWAHPRVSVLKPETFPGWEGTKDIIQEGDLLHVDFGITTMGMNTDTQHMAYVLRTSQGEQDVPEGLKKGLKKANRMQDISLEKMKAGKTGNQVLKKCLDQMKADGIEGQVYSHPIGEWGHSAGAVMGFTNLPDFVPVLGELEILPNTFYSIELYAYHFIPERNETIRFRVEEDAYWVDDERGWEFVRGRQERFHLVNYTSPVEGKFSFIVQN